MQGTTDLKKLQKQLKNERVANALAMEAASRVLNRHVLNRLKDIATGKAEEKVAETSEEKPAVKATKSKKTAEAPKATAETTEPAKVKKTAKKVEKSEDK